MCKKTLAVLVEKYMLNIRLVFKAIYEYFSRNSGHKHTHIKFTSKTCVHIQYYSITDIYNQAKTEFALNQETRKDNLKQK